MNFQMSYTDFANYVSKNFELLYAAKSNKKYAFKFKSQNNA